MGALTQRGLPLLGHLPIDGILGPSNIGPNALSPVSSLRKTRATLEALQGGGWTQLLKSQA